MTELERFATAVLEQWRNEGGGDAEPIAVSALLDRVLPYRVARRVLGIDVSEDYEALMLRLLAEDGGLVAVIPPDAAELARTTVASRLPDLGVLQLLRSASMTMTARTIAAADATPAAATAPQSSDSPWAPPPASATKPAEPSPAKAPPAETVHASERTTCWSCAVTLPTGHAVKFCPFCGADQRQPSCSACGAAAERGWKHCAECGTKL